MVTIIDACQYATPSCINFKKVNNELIKMVNEHYFDLQMYANFVFDIDNDQTPLSNKNNFYTRLQMVKSKYPDTTLFVPENMAKLKKLVSKILTTLIQNRISAKQYLSDLTNIEFFGSGANSPTILLKAYRKLPSTVGAEQTVMPLIIKIFPFQLPHHYANLAINPKDKVEFVQTYIESPGYALFLKEAWMYCFSKNELAKYTSTFTCVSNCYIIDGMPINSIKELTNIYQVYAKKRLAAGKTLPYKKWFNILIDPRADVETRKNIMAADYGCFEMKQIEGTLEDLSNKPVMLNLSIIFEYLYTKVVSAFVGRVIFTDDHFGNVAYITVDYTRYYKIKCNGCDYHFYIPPGKMVQFIDLERYVFNYSPYDIYTNIALKSVEDKDFKNRSTNLTKIKTLYDKNNYIYDKSLQTLIGPYISAKNFTNQAEYQIMLRILTSPFLHDIKTFCQIMEANLPAKYLTKPQDNVVEYYLDLDNDKLRVIDLEGLYKQIE